MSFSNILLSFGKLQLSTYKYILIIYIQTQIHEENTNITKTMYFAIAGLATV